MPRYNPRDIVETLVALMKGEEPKTMIPWYANFKVHPLFDAFPLFRPWLNFCCVPIQQGTIQPLIREGSEYESFTVTGSFQRSGSLFFQPLSFC